MPIYGFDCKINTNMAGVPENIRKTQRSFENNFKIITVGEQKHEKLPQSEKITVKADILLS